MRIFGFFNKIGLKWRDRVGYYVMLLRFTTLAFPHLKLCSFGKSTLILSKTLSDFHVSISELVWTCLNLSKLVWNWFSLFFQSIDDEPPMSFYGVYDGHAGKDAAAFAASHLHGKFLSAMSLPLALLRI